MTRNIGALDTAIRAILGVGLLILVAVFTERPNRSGRAGRHRFSNVHHGADRSLPAALLGINTCPREVKTPSI
jgi:hypothetical protein